MSVVRARPLGSGDPPDEVLITTPVYRWGVAKAWVPTRGDARLRVEVEGGGPVILEVPFSEGKMAGGFLTFEVHGVRPGVRYDGSISFTGERLPLFAGAELYRLAIDDPSTRALPGVLGRGA